MAETQVDGPVEGKGFLTVLISRFPNAFLEKFTIVVDSHPLHSRDDVN